jgi:dihydrofolate reductase
MGKPILMGRKTYESIGRPLPGRSNIVLTRDASYQAPGVIVVTSVNEALAVAAKEAERLKADEISVIGGASLYEETLPQADRIYWSEVHASIPGDTFFPDYDRAEWREVLREGPIRNPGEPYAYSFIVLDRRVQRG